MRVLLVIDMQEEYVGQKKRHGYNSSELINLVNARILQAQLHHELIIYIKNKKTLKSGTQISNFVQGLQLLSPYVFNKEKASVFSNPEIVSFLQEHNITEVETIGVDGNCCVAASAMEAAKMGLTVVFPFSCIGFKNLERYNKTKELLRKSGVTVVE